MKRNCVIFFLAIWSICMSNAQQSNSGKPQPYTFSYSVNNPDTNDIKAREETSDGKMIRGWYSLVESDGSKRIVKYTADDKVGFQATVERVKASEQNENTHKETKKEPSVSSDQEHHQNNGSEIRTNRNRDGNLGTSNGHNSTEVKESTKVIEIALSRVNVETTLNDTDQNKNESSIQLENINPLSIENRKAPYRLIQWNSRNDDRNHVESKFDYELTESDRRYQGRNEENFRHVPFDFINIDDNIQRDLQNRRRRPETETNHRRKSFREEDDSGRGPGYVRTIDWNRSKTSDPDERFVLDGQPLIAKTPISVPQSNQRHQERNFNNRNNDYPAPWISRRYESNEESQPAASHQTDIYDDYYDDYEENLQNTPTYSKLIQWNIKKPQRSNLESLRKTYHREIPEVNRAKDKRPTYLVQSGINRQWNADKFYGTEGKYIESRLVSTNSDVFRSNIEDKPWERRNQGIVLTAENRPRKYRLPNNPERFDIRGKYSEHTKFNTTNNSTSNSKEASKEAKNSRVYKTVRDYIRESAQKQYQPKSEELQVLGTKVDYQQFPFIGNNRRILTSTKVIKKSEMNEDEFDDYDFKNENVNRKGFIDAIEFVDSNYRVGLIDDKENNFRNLDVGPIHWRSEYPADFVDGEEANFETSYFPLIERGKIRSYEIPSTAHSKRKLSGFGCNIRTY